MNTHCIYLRCAAAGDRPYILFPAERVHWGNGRARPQHTGSNAAPRRTAAFNPATLSMHLLASHRSASLVVASICSREVVDCCSISNCFSEPHGGPICTHSNEFATSSGPARMPKRRRRTSYMTHALPISQTDK